MRFASDADLVICAGEVSPATPLWEAGNAWGGVCHGGPALPRRRLGLVKA